MYPPGHFKFIWASPDCCTWSVASSSKHRLLRENLAPRTEKARIADRQILRVLEIIEYFQPTYYVLENPRGRLRHFPTIKKITFRTSVYYVNYGCGLVKPTDLWSNTKLWPTEKKPKGVRTDPDSWDYSTIPKNRRLSRSIVPKKLLQKIFNYIHY